MFSEIHDDVRERQACQPMKDKVVCIDVLRLSEGEVKAWHKMAEDFA